MTTAPKLIRLAERYEAEAAQLSIDPDHTDACLGQMLQLHARELRSLAAEPVGGDDILRKLLAINYSGTALYTDDGELQDAYVLSVIDFLRDAPAEIERKIMQRAADSVDAKQPDSEEGDPK